MSLTLLTTTLSRPQSPIPVVSPNLESTFVYELVQLSMESLRKGDRMSLNDLSGPFTSLSCAFVIRGSPERT